MSLYQSKWANGQYPMPISREARGVVTERLKFTVSEDLSTDDIIEMGALPAFHFVTDMVLVSDALGSGVTADIGIISGDYGDDDDSRTSGDEFFDGTDVSAAAVNRMEEAEGFRVASTDADRGIGIKIGGAGVTASDQVLTLLVSYVQ